MSFDEDEYSDNQRIPKKPSGTAKADRSGVAKKESSPKKKWKKPQDMPKRPLSAYNLFFADQRRHLLGGGETDLAIHQGTASESGLTEGKASTKKLGFAGLARSVAATWKGLSRAMRAPYEEEAQREQARYKLQINEYNQNRLRTQTSGSGSSSPAPSRIAEGFLSRVNGADVLASSAVWPAMPHTVASLGDMYDGDNGHGSSSAHRASIGTDNDQLETIAFAALARHQGGFGITALGNSADSGSFPSSPRPDQQIPSTGRNTLQDPVGFFQEATTTQHEQQNTELAGSLMHHARITHLVSQLDEDQVDFLKSLKESPTDDG
jgi:HMG (high mobility group) box